MRCVTLRPIVYPGAGLRSFEASQMLAAIERGCAAMEGVFILELSPSSISLEPRLQRLTI